MRVIDSKEQMAGIVPGQVLTIGNFDGVHAGHQKILEYSRKQALKSKASGVAVLTFYPHPAAILHPDQMPGVLTPLDIKVSLLAEQQVDTLIIVKDNYEMLNLSPQGFVDEFLMAHIKPSAVVEGPNFNFGYGRSGDLKTLAELGASRGFGVVVVPPAQAQSAEMISSSMIRRLLQEGQVAQAAVALTRPYRLVGRTVRGRGKGTEIGFPTANIEPAEQIIPAEGVYAGHVEIGESRASLISSRSRIPAAFSVGRAKTFVQDHALLIEAHLLDGHVPDLTGKWLAMDFVERVRGQQRFASVEELVTQIKADCQRIRQMLARGR